ncbi:MAG: HAMP domain-containing sensor histidine kinase [Planctomycetota bacterium]
MTPPPAEPDRRARRTAFWRGSMYRQLLLWLVLMTAVPTLALSLWMERASGEAMARLHRQSIETMTQAVASALSGRLSDGWSPEAAGVMESIALDRRVALAIVLDRDRRVLHRRAIDADAWVAYERMMDGQGAIDLEIGRPVRLEGEGVLRAQLQPVWDRPPARGRGAPTGGADRRLEGFVVLALRDRTMPEVLQGLRAAQLVGGGVICLAMLPVAAWGARQWTRPIARVDRAAQRLTEGADPDPLPEGDDELGQLARSFNAMHRHLDDARRELIDANRELEGKVADRTRELDNANRRLKAEMADKDAFLRAVTHDLGAPLRNIDGMASMLLMKYKTDLADDALRKLERISANAKLQTDLIADLLELSRLRADRGKREPVDLDELTRQIVESLDYELTTYAVTLTLENHLPTVRAERNRLRQVMQNLLDNAVKYTRDRPRREVRVRSEVRDGEHVIEVIDTGCGIEPRELGKVFEVFQRAAQPAGQRVEGRGIGLASVRSILEAHGGWIEVESTPGVGSTFRFALPVEPLQSGEPGAEAGPVAAGRG